MLAFAATFHFKSRGWICLERVFQRNTIIQTKIILSVRTKSRNWRRPKCFQHSKSWLKQPVSIIKPNLFLKVKTGRGVGPLNDDSKGLCEGWSAFGSIPEYHILIQWSSYRGCKFISRSLDDIKENKRGNLTAFAQYLQFPQGKLFEIC